MTWITPSFFTTGAILLASQLNTMVVNNSNFLYSPPACALGRTSGKAINNGSEQVVDWDFEVFDTNSMHTGSSTQIFATVTGKFGMTGAITWAASNTGSRVIRLRKNGSGYFIDWTASSTANTVNKTVVGVLDFQASDYMDLSLQQDSGGVLSTTSQSCSLFWIAG